MPNQKSLKPGDHAQMADNIFQAFVNNKDLIPILLFKNIHFVGLIIWSLALDFGGLGKVTMESLASNIARLHSF